MVVIFFAILSTVFSIVSPKILGMATDKLFENRPDYIANEFKNENFIKITEFDSQKKIAFMDRQKI